MVIAMSSVAGRMVTRLIVVVALEVEVVHRRQRILVGRIAETVL